jgi:hypothetical protein
MATSSSSAPLSPDYQCHQILSGGNNDHDESRSSSGTSSSNGQGQLGPSSRKTKQQDVDADAYADAYADCRDCEDCTYQNCSCNDAAATADAAANTAAVLPGYECQLWQDGVAHSRRKLRESANELIRDCLSSTATHIIMTNNCINTSTPLSSPSSSPQHTSTTATATTAPCNTPVDVDVDVSVHLVPCVHHEDTVGYRVACAFQIVPVLANNHGSETTTDSCNHNDDDHDNDNDDDPSILLSKLQFAMRRKGQVVPLEASYFAIAVPRIQAAMTAMLQILNSTITNKQQRVVETETCTCNVEGGGDCDCSHTQDTSSNKYKYPLLRQHLSSVSFKCTWDETELVVTLNYEPPGLPLPRRRRAENEDNIEGNTDNYAEWIQQASVLQTAMAATYLAGKSKHNHIWLPQPRCELEGKEETPPIKIMLHDEMQLSLLHTTKLDSPPLMSRQQSLSRVDDHLRKVRAVKYVKPEGAFQHPNRNVMRQALDWLLSQSASIARNLNGNGHSNGDCQPKKQPQPRLQLLELYNGMGAHTVPLALCNIYHKIVCLELDQRLVDACLVNLTLNGIPILPTTTVTSASSSGNKTTTAASSTATSSSTLSTTNISRSTPATVLRGDAGKLARTALRRLLTSTDDNDEPSTTSENSTNSNSSTPPTISTVLLVDPPRQGVDMKVCQLALQNNGDETTIQHILYVSCGREALRRDLQVLCNVNVNNHFRVVSCTLLDLFPRTDAVETLVHLERVPTATLTRNNNMATFSDEKTKL